jgi:hypothetical protein
VRRKNEGAEPVRHQRARSPVGVDAPVKLSASQRRRNKEQSRRHKVRRAALSKPITLEQICEFSSRLVKVDYGTGSGCWLHPAKSMSGASNAYARISHNGLPVLAHRFALAVKLGCAVWALEGYDCAHSSKAVCLGGRCCNPQHLTKKLSDPNRSWDRAKDAKKFGDKVITRTPAEVQAMIHAMYPTGANCNSRFFDDPWQSNASLELLRFLELGFKNELQNMRQDRNNTPHQRQ